MRKVGVQLSIAGCCRGRWRFKCQPVYRAKHRDKSSTRQREPTRVRAVLGKWMLRMANLLSNKKTRDISMRYEYHNGSLSPYS